MGRFQIVTLVIQRARQLENGAHPRIAGNGHKSARVALGEVLAGAVSWSLTPAEEAVPASR